MTARLLGGGLAAALLGACAAAPDIGEVYPRTVAEVRAALLDVPLPSVLAGTQHASLAAREQADGAIELALLDRRDLTQLRFRAVVTKVDARSTRVAVDYAGAGSAYAAADKGMADHPEIRALYVKTMRERVDATLERRAFRASSIAPEMSLAYAANAGTILRNANAAGEAMRKRDRANIDKAYAAEKRGDW